MSEKKLPEGWTAADITKLVQIEMFADNTINPIERHTPLHLDEQGFPNRDDSRPVRYFSVVGVQRHPAMPPQPLKYEIEAKSLAEAFEKAPMAGYEFAQKTEAEIESNAIKSQILSGTAMGKVN